MATDATGTPTTNFSIPKFNVNNDAPSGLGFNAAMDVIDALLSSRTGNLSLTSGLLTVAHGVTIGDASNTGFPITSMRADVATRQMLLLGISGDTQPRMAVQGDGKLVWGPGGATAVDTNLYRAGAGTLKTDTAFQAVGDIAGSWNASLLAYDLQTSAHKLFFGGDTNLYRDPGAVLRTDNLLRVVGLSVGTSGYGTTFPVSPLDGQYFTLVDSITAPTYQWHFRYNVNSLSSFKWEFIGGAPAHFRVNTLESTTSASYTNLTTTGPTFPAVHAGDYQVRYGYLGNINVVGANAQATVYNSTGTTRYTAGEADLSSANFVTATAEELITVTAGSNVQLKYLATGGTAQFAERYLSVTPVRVI